MIRQFDRLSVECLGKRQVSLPHGSPLPDGSRACALPDQSLPDGSRAHRACDTLDSGIQSLAKADRSSRKTVYFKKFGHCIQL